MSHRSVRRLTQGAVIAALYVALTLALPASAYGPIQLRISEALTVLPFLCPAAVPGLFVGCVVSNLLSPYGLPDLILGSAATLLAALWTARVPVPALAPLPPVVCNGLLVGGMLAWYETGFGPAFPAAFAYHGVTVALGQLVVCALLGGVLLAALSRAPHLCALLRAD